MAALNSLPVIGSSTPVATTPPPAPVVRSVFPAECEQFGEQLVSMGYEKLIVLKSIQLFGKDEHKCIGLCNFNTKLDHIKLQLYWSTVYTVKDTFQLRNYMYELEKMSVK